MTLRRCLDALRRNQKNGTDEPVPYRSSKITHIFRQFFEVLGGVKLGRDKTIILCFIQVYSFSATGYTVKPILITVRGQIELPQFNSYFLVNNIMTKCILILNRRNFD